MPDGVVPALADRPSIGHLLRDRAARTPDRYALRFGTERLTFSDVEDRSTRVANRLAQLGIVAGDRVGIMMPNCLDYPIVWLGIVRLGAVVVPVNIGYQESDLGYVLTDSGARALVATDAFQPLIDVVAPRCLDLELVLVWDGPSRRIRAGIDEAMDSFKEQVAAEPPGFPVEHLHPDTLATLQYTSGTTGFPKGCMLVHRGWIECAVNYVYLGDFTADDVAVILTPFYYGDFGWNLVLAILVGMELAMLPRFSASTLWRSIREVGGTFFYCLGTMPILLLKQTEDPSVDRGHDLRWVSCSGIPAERHREIETRWGVPWREAYGTTEIGFATATLLDETDTVGSGTIGHLTPGYTGRLVNAAGGDVAPGEVGEFICRGPHWFSLGYWRNPEATAVWMRDGWAHTGDLMRQDCQGRYFLVGRTKDMIRRGGENIAAAEVEAALCEHPSVGNAACVSVPDEIRGEEVLAYIQPRGSVPDPEAVLAHCRARLAAFKVPRYLRFIAHFPLTPSQRVEKHKLSRDLPGSYDAQRQAWR